MSKSKPYASITINFRASGTEVLIQNFEKITPSRIEKAYEYVLKEWDRLRRVAIWERRKAEAAEKEKVDA